MFKNFIFTLCLILLIYNVSFTQISEDNFYKFEADRKNSLAKQINLAELSKTQNMEDYDAKYYELNLSIDPVLKLIAGHVKITAEVISPISALELHFYNNMEIDSVNVNGNNSRYTHANNLLTLSLGRTYSAGETINAKISYHGRPVSGSFGFDSYAGKPMIWTLSEPFGARTWWPCKDIPSDKADSIDIVITVPKDLIVASNGSLKEETLINSEQKLYWWHEKYPIVTYLVSLAIYPYYVYYDDYVSLSNDTMKLHFYVFPDHYNSLRYNYSLTKDMITAFANLFGEYPFLDEKYGHAEFLWGGGMEHQTLTSLGGWGETLIAHELSHQWWGDMVTCNSFHHIWLNEGFATYSESLWREWTQGISAYHNYQRNKFYFGRGTIFVEDPLNDSIFDSGLSYNKGSCVLHMLRHMVGENKFFEILKTYHNSPAHQFGTATTEEFRDLCETISGMELDRFFQQWIYEEGFPEYEFLYGKKYLPSNQYEVFGIIKQIQTIGPVFEMPLDITITTATGDTTLVVWSKEAVESFTFLIDKEPLNVQLDKDQWVLRRIYETSYPLVNLQDYNIDDAAGNSNGSLDPGETVNLNVSIYNGGLPIDNLSLVLYCRDTDVLIVDSVSYIGNIGIDTTFDNEAAPFKFSISPDLEGKYLLFYLKLKQNEIQIDKLEFYIPAGEQQVLLLDNDFGLDHETYFETLLKKISVYYKLWDVVEQGFPDSLFKYEKIVWFTGLADYNTCPELVQNKIRDYLNQGGKLLVSSQNMAHDLSVHGRVSDSLFLAEVLGVNFKNNISKESTAIGVMGDPISNNLVVTFGSGQLNNQFSRDEIDPVYPAVSILNYNSSKNSAGVRLKNEATGSKVVFLGFGLEGVSGPYETSAQTLLSRIFEWFDFETTDIKTAIASTLPDKYLLLQNYPNPFNPTTSICFAIPEASKITLEIYNVLGQKIRTLLTKQIQAGYHKMIWDGMDDFGNTASSGIYIYQLKNSTIKIQQKMLLIR